jgi:hypothetical protein
MSAEELHAALLAGGLDLGLMDEHGGKDSVIETLFNRLLAHSEPRQFLTDEGYGEFADQIMEVLATVVPKSKPKPVVVRMPAVPASVTVTAPMTPVTGTVVTELKSSGKPTLAPNALMPGHLKDGTTPIVTAVSSHEAARAAKGRKAPPAWPDLVLAGPDVPAGKYTVAGLLGMMEMTKANNFAAAAAVLAIMGPTNTKAWTALPHIAAYVSKSPGKGKAKGDDGEKTRSAMSLLVAFVGTAEPVATRHGSHEAANAQKEAAKGSELPKWVEVVLAHEDVPGGHTYRLNQLAAALGLTNNMSAASAILAMMGPENARAWASQEHVANHVSKASKKVTKKESKEVPSGGAAVVSYPSFVSKLGKQKPEMVVQLLEAPRKGSCVAEAWEEKYKKALEPLMGHTTTLGELKKVLGGMYIASAVWGIATDASREQICA